MKTIKQQVPKEPPPRGINPAIRAAILQATKRPEPDCDQIQIKRLCGAHVK